MFRALSPSCVCDLAVLKDAQLLRVEVTSGVLSAHGTLMHPGKVADKFDLLAIYVGSEDRIIYKPDLESLLP